MLYLGIDQHKRQLTVNVRGEDGKVVLKRQVSTQWEKVRAFFADLAEKADTEGGFWAILEVCGMNGWLLEMLAESVGAGGGTLRRTQPGPCGPGHRAERVSLEQREGTHQAEGRLPREGRAAVGLDEALATTPDERGHRRTDQGVPRPRKNRPSPGRRRFPKALKRRSWAAS